MDLVQVMELHPYTAATRDKQTRHVIPGFGLAVAVMGIKTRMSTWAEVGICGGTPSGLL